VLKRHEKVKVHNLLIGVVLVAFVGVANIKFDICSGFLFLIGIIVIVVQASALLRKR
jgi:hypothetical protein